MSILNECELEKFNAKLKENIDEHESEALDPRIQVIFFYKFNSGLNWLLVIIGWTGAFKQVKLGHQQNGEWARRSQTTVHKFKKSSTPTAGVFAEKVRLMHRQSQAVLRSAEANRKAAVRDAASRAGVPASE